MAWTASAIYNLVFLFLIAIIYHNISYEDDSPKDGRLKKQKKSINPAYPSYIRTDSIRTNKVGVVILEGK